MYDENKLRAELERDEGNESVPYFDTLGIPSGGIGRNFQAHPIEKEVIDRWYAQDVARAEETMDNLYHPWRGLTDVRQRVLVNMAFNMGQSRLGGFRKMWAAIREQDYEEAAVQMLDSKWAGQVGPRAPRLADMMRAG